MSRGLYCPECSEGCTEPDSQYFPENPCNNAFATRLEPIRCWEIQKHFSSTNLFSAVSYAMNYSICIYLPSKEGDMCRPTNYSTGHFNTIQEGSY